MSRRNRLGISTCLTCVAAGVAIYYYVVAPTSPRSLLNPLPMKRQETEERLVNAEEEPVLVNNIGVEGGDSEIGIGKDLAFRVAAEQIRTLSEGGERTKLLFELIDRWAVADPSSCIEYLETMETDPLRVALSTRALSAWLAISREEARGFAIDRIIQDEENCEYYLAPVLEDAIRLGGFSAMSGVLEKLPQENSVYAEVTPLFAKYFWSNSSEAMEFVSEVKNVQAKLTYLEIAGALETIKDPAAAMSAVEKGEVLSSSELMGVCSVLLKSNPIETVEWLNGIEKSDAMELALIREGQKWSSKDPKIAMSLFAMVSDLSTRESLELMALDHWAQSDYQEALNWAVKSDLPVDAVAEAVVSFDVENELESLPAKIEMIKQMPDGILKTRSLSGVWPRWASSDRVSAMAWLSDANLSAADKAGLLESVKESEE